MSFSSVFIFVAAAFLVHCTHSYGISRIDESKYRISRRFNTMCHLVLSRQEATWTLDSPQRSVRGIHLAATGDSHSMRVSWSSQAICAPARVEVEQLLEEGTLEFVASREEPYEMLISGYKSGYFFNALLTQLSEATSYRYRVGCGNYWSDTFTFTTPPSHGDMSPVKVFILGDHGTRLEGKRTLDAMLEAHRQSKHDLVIHVGDISYANGGSQEYIWDVWAEMVEPIAAQLPYMVTPGNHEILHADSGGELGIPYMKRFSMPMETQGSYSEYWYSWNYGQIHFVSVSSEHAQNVSQQQWVADDLRNASLHRDKTAWFIVVGHHSIYTSNQRHGNQTELRKWLDPLLLTYNVDIVFWGHDHAYERTYPITNSTVVQTDYEDPKAPVHVTCGASGWDLHDCWQPNVTFSAFHTAHTWGYCTLHVISPTIADVKFVDSENKTVLDSVRIRKNRTERSLISDNKEVNMLVNPVNRVTDGTEQLTINATESGTTVATMADANVNASKRVQKTRPIPTESNEATNQHSGSAQEVPYTSTSLSYTINSESTIISPQLAVANSNTTQLVPDSGSNSVPSKSLGLSVVGWVAISSVASIAVTSVACYLARQRRRRKGRKYELVPLQDLSPSGSDSET